jgi:predicted phosphodiesterase
MQIKVAIFTDVHGNYPALKAVLEEIDRIGDIDHIYCLGDMIAIGPDTNQVLETLFSRKAISMITGNHDEAILALIEGKEHPESHSHVRKHHEWIAERMDNSFVSKLAELPRYIKKKSMEKSLLFLHYHIEGSKLNKHISQDPFSKIKKPSLENMEELFKGHSEDLICFGHHHPTHFFFNKDRGYINPGSLGCHHHPFARFAIITIKNHSIDVELCQVPYNNQAFLASYEKLQVPDREFILKIFHGNQLII